MFHVNFMSFNCSVTEKARGSKGSLEVLQIFQEI